MGELIMKDVKSMTLKGIKKQLNLYLTPFIVKNRPTRQRYIELVEEFEKRITNKGGIDTNVT